MSTAKLYVDESYFSPIEPEVPSIDEKRVSWYKKYFEKMMNFFTFHLRTTNGYDYYVFSKVEQDEWERRVKNKLTIQATPHLDNIEMQGVSIYTIQEVNDVTEEVRNQYREQRDIIFNTYHLVEEIMQYKESSFVKEMSDYVLESRKVRDVRSYWRVINEKYYGLDIHPLMEFEVDELEKILYYCQHPEQQLWLTWKPRIKNTAITISAAVVALLSYLFLSNN